MKYILILLVACNDQGKTKLSDVKRDVAQAANTTADYAKEGVQETRDDAVKASESQLAAIDKKMTQLKADLAKRNDAAKTTAQKTLDDLEAKRKELADNVEQMKKDTADGWKETRRKASAVAGAFEASFDDLKKRLDKI